MHPQYYVTPHETLRQVVSGLEEFREGALVAARELRRTVAAVRQWMEARAEAEAVSEERLEALQIPEREALKRIYG